MPLDLDGVVLTTAGLQFLDVRLEFCRFVEYIQKNGDSKQARKLKEYAEALVKSQEGIEKMLSTLTTTAISLG